MHARRRRLHRRILFSTRNLSAEQKQGLLRAARRLAKKLSTDTTDKDQLKAVEMFVIRARKDQIFALNKKWDAIGKRHEHIAVQRHIKKCETCKGKMKEVK